jgi:hypothetical protein
MKQIVHIFRKDLRHHWPEVLVSLALLIGYTWDAPSRWLPDRETMGESRVYSILYGSLLALLVLSWSLLIVRVIQSERLAGDRQYWLTRPVEWKRLLAAKILFIALFADAPLLFAQLVLLKEAGFKLALSYVPELLWIHLGLILICFLPVAALATVTTTIAQVVIALLAIGAYIAGVATVAAYVPSANFSSGSDTLQLMTLTGLCLVAVVWQYSQRETNRSRVLLGIAAGLILILVVATPYRTLVAYEYPQPRAAELRPVQLVVDSVKPSPSEDKKAVPDKAKDVAIRVPLLVSGIAEGSTVTIDGKMITLEAQDGSSWSSGWEGIGRRLQAKELRIWLNFEVNKKVFERMKSSPVKVRISLAVTVFHSINTTEVVVKDGEFAVPNGGLCSIAERYELSNVLQCRYPIRSPTMLVTIASSKATCPAPEGKAPRPGLTARDWSTGSAADPFSPVQTEKIDFWNWDASTDYKESPVMCPGTPLTFSTSEASQLAGVELEMDGVHLADYRAENSINISFRL